MAKKSDKRKSTGGGFGSAKTPNPQAGEKSPVPDHNPIEAKRESERMMRAIQQALTSQNFESTEDMTKFMNENFVGRPMSEIIGNLEEDEPQDDLGHAQRLMDDLSDDAPPSQARRIARQALALSPGCLDAWLTLALTEKQTTAATKALLNGIEHGRKRFADLISSVDEKSGLWGWVDARPLMRLYHQLALIQETTDQEEEALATYKEMLRLNPSDNQGIRGATLRLLLVLDDLAEAHALLRRRPDDSLIDMIYGRAFLSILEAMETTGVNFPENENDDPRAPRTPDAFYQNLGPAFNTAKTHVQKALTANPYVSFFMYQPQLFQVQAPDRMIIGGPFEALCYAQEWAHLWHGTGLPQVVLAAATNAAQIKAALKNDWQAAEMQEAMHSLDEHHGTPWWEDLERVLEP